jgi:hypothetical protein
MTGASAAADEAPTLKAREVRTSKTTSFFTVLLLLLLVVSRPVKRADTVAKSR